MILNRESHSLLFNSSYSNELKAIADKVYNGERISFNEGLMLYNKAELGFVGALANFVRHKKSGDKVFFNHNFHVEPTNVCV